MNLKGRNFLTLKEFKPEEIMYLLVLASELKSKKKAGELHEYYKGKNIALIFEKTAQEPDVPLRWLPMILEWAVHILIRKVLRLAKKRALQIQRACWDVCMTESNTEALDRRL